jgi:hypothetical protein
MAIHVRQLEHLKKLAEEVRAPRARDAYGVWCPRCAELGVAVLQLGAEVEQLRAPYAKAFREGASGALDFAARTFEAMGEQRSAAVLRQMQSAVGK